MLFSYCVSSCCVVVGVVCCCCCGCCYLCSFLYPVVTGDSLSVPLVNTVDVALASTIPVVVVNLATTAVVVVIDTGPVSTAFSIALI